MKGVEIIHNDKTTIIGIDNGLLTIHIDSVNINDRKEAFIYSGSIEYETRNRNIWHEFTPINIGDVFEINIVDIQDIDPPIKSVNDSNTTRPMSKLEEFYQLESFLKEKGLL